jgi:predicted nucleic acid-binding Zn finger protein
MFTPALRLNSDPAVVTSRFKAFISTWPVSANRFNQRLLLAQDLASTSGAVMQLGPDRYQVASQSKPGTSYIVTLSAKSCTCPDHIAHAGAGVICKHRLAVALYVGWGEPTEVERQHMAMAARQAEQRAGYITFLSSHPYVSPFHISFTEFCQYPRLGVVAYDHPLQGEISVPCLAGVDFNENQDPQGALRVQVIALTGTPFVHGLWATTYLTTAADRFTPGLPGNVIL